MASVDLRCQTAASRRRCSARLPSVSYTHLDVYKRQAQTDAVWSFEDKFAQEFCQRARVDVLHRDGAALGAGNCLLGHKDDVVRLGVWLGILFDDLTYIILIGDDMGADCKTLV